MPNTSKAAYCRPRPPVRPPVKGMTTIPVYIRQNSDRAPPPSISHAAICVHPSKKSAQTNARSTPSGRNLKVSQRFSRQSNWTLPLPCERFSFCVPHLPRPMAIMIAGQPRSTYIPVTISQPSRKSIEHARPTYHSLQRLLIAYMNHSIDRTHS